MSLWPRADWIQRMIWKATLSPPPRISCVTFAKKQIALSKHLFVHRTKKHKAIASSWFFSAVLQNSINHTQNQGSLKTKMVDQEMRQESELIEYMEKYKQITIYCDIQKNHVRFVKEIPVHWICGTLKFLQTRERGKQNQFTLRNNLIKIHQYTQKLSKLDLKLGASCCPRFVVVIVNIQSTDSNNSANMCFSFAKRWKWKRSGVSDFTSQARCCSVLSEISSRQLVEHPGGFGQFVEIKQPANGLASEVTNGDQLKWIIAPFSIFPEFKWMKSVLSLCNLWVYFRWT